MTFDVLIIRYNCVFTAFNIWVEIYFNFLVRGEKVNMGNMGNRNAVGMVGMVGQGKFIMIDEKKVVFSYKPQTIIIPGVRFDRTTLRL